MTDDQVLDGAAEELEKLDAPKLWLTARGLAKRMRARAEFGGLTQIHLYDVLLREPQLRKGHRRIRNSRLPSVHTLETLWGAIRADGNGVTDVDVPPPVLRRSLTDAADSQDLHEGEEPGEEGEELEESPACFLSYNFGDTDDVERIVGILEGRGYSIWFAGARIRPDQNINSEVIRALDGADRHFLYLSIDSLKSLWVGKEMIVGQSRELEQTIIVRAADHECLGLVRDWIERNDTAATRSFEESRGGVSLEAAREFQAILMGHFEDPTQQIYFFSEEPEELDPPLLPRLLPLQQIPVMASDDDADL